MHLLKLVEDFIGRVFYESLKKNRNYNIQSMMKLQKAIDLLKEPVYKRIKPFMAI